MYDEKFMEIAILEAKEALRFEEVPIGAVIVKDGIVLAKAGNFKERDNVATHHAEMVAIERAAKALGNWYLEDCEMYVTLEPCPMCAMAAVLSRLKAIYFGAYDPKCGGLGSKINIAEKGMFNHNIDVSGGYKEKECASLLSNFFKGKRKH